MLRRGYLVIAWPAPACSHRSTLQKREFMFKFWLLIRGHLQIFPSFDELFYSLLIIIICVRSKLYSILLHTLEEKYMGKFIEGNN